MLISLLSLVVGALPVPAQTVDGRHQAWVSGGFASAWVVQVGGGFRLTEGLRLDVQLDTPLVRPLVLGGRLALGAGLLRRLGDWFGLVGRLELGVPWSNDFSGSWLAVDVRAGVQRHSFGGMYASLYVGRRPDRVDHLALLEPGGLNGAIFGPTYPSLIRVDLLGPGLNSMFWQNEVLSPSTHERLDLRALMALQGENTPGYFCDPKRPPEIPLWRPGGHVDLLRSALLQGRGAPGTFDYDFTVGVDRFQGPVVLVGGSCSLLGPEYQRQYHLPFFPRGRVITIEGAGHRFPTEKPAETMSLLRAFLKE